MMLTTDLRWSLFPTGQLPYYRQFELPTKSSSRHRCSPAVSCSSQYTRLTRSFDLTDGLVAGVQSRGRVRSVCWSCVNAACCEKQGAQVSRHGSRKTMVRVGDGTPPEKCRGVYRSQ